MTKGGNELAEFVEKNIYELDAQMTKRSIDQLTKNVDKLTDKIDMTTQKVDKADMNIKHHNETLSRFETTIDKFSITIEKLNNNISRIDTETAVNREKFNLGMILNWKVLCSIGFCIGIIVNALK